MTDNRKIRWSGKWKDSTKMGLENTNYRQSWTGAHYESKKSKLKLQWESTRHPPERPKLKTGNSKC